MSPRTLIVVVLALVCGLVAAGGVLMMNNRAGGSVPMGTAVFAVEEIDHGETIKPESLELRTLPADRVPADAVKALADATGRVARIPMLKGEAVVEPKLTPKGTGSGMASLIPEGKRAVTISVPATHAGLQANNWVDIHVTRETPSRSGEPGGPKTKLLLQNVQILAVDSKVGGETSDKASPNGIRTVTLLVDPGEDAKLGQGRDGGTLHLSLRNPKDRTILPEPPAPEPPPPPPIPQGLASRIAPGKRAFTIRSANLSSHFAGGLHEGDSVDVLNTSKSTGGPENDKEDVDALLLLQGVKVLEVDVKPTGGSTDPTAPKEFRSITVEVRPEDATILSRGLALGKLDLALRNPDDEGLTALPEEPGPEFYELIQTTRTMRGTHVGSERGTIRVRNARALAPKLGSIADSR